MKTSEITVDILKKMIDIDKTKKIRQRQRKEVYCEDMKMPMLFIDCSTTCYGDGCMYLKECWCDR